MRIHDARLHVCAARRDAFPREGLPEFAFAGRSNVGKSSLLNALVGRKALARTSRQPGRTQQVNFFLLNRKLLFVDLPGYGYARAPRRVRAAFAPLVESYLIGRGPLRMVWILVDSRHPPTEHDAMLCDFLRSEKIPCRVALTKTDKLSGNQRAVATRRAASVLALEEPGQEPIATSAQRRSGMREVWSVIEARLERKPNPPAPHTGGDPTPRRLESSSAAGDFPGPASVLEIP